MIGLTFERLDALCEVGFDLSKQEIPLSDNLKFDGVVFSSLDPFEQWALDLGHRLQADVRDSVWQTNET